MIAKLSDQEIGEVLEDNILGHLGCNDGFNTYVYPVNYLYDGKSILCHSQDGAKVKVMRQNSRVCLQVDEIVDHENWRSVMVLGDFQELHDERERSNAMKAFVDRQMHVKITRANLSTNKDDQGGDAGLDKERRPVIFRIVIDEKTGRYEVD